MNIGRVLKDIEDFEKAYYERWADFKVMMKSGRKIMCMHLGGIIIECLLKNGLVKYNKITKSDGEKWYTGSSKDGVDINNPRHNLRKAFRLLQGESINRFVEINKKIEIVYNPLQKENCSFVDLRYYTEDDVNTHVYDNWHSSFEECHKWIISHLKLGRRF